MRYFTRAWASGELSDAECEAVIPRYNRDLAAAFAADSSIFRFARSVGLNDAYVDRVVFDRSNASLRLLLMTGSLQVGYWHTELAYHGVTRISGEDVLKSALTKRPTEIWYDEFFREDDNVWHAFLLTPQESSLEGADEFAIRFSAFEYSQSPAIDRLLLSDEDRSGWNAS